MNIACPPSGKVPFSFWRSLPCMETKQSEFWGGLIKKCKVEVWNHLRASQWAPHAIELSRKEQSGSRITHLSCISGNRNKQVRRSGLARFVIPHAVATAYPIFLSMLLFYYSRLSYQGAVCSKSIKSTNAKNKLTKKPQQRHGSTDLFRESRVSWSHVCSLQYSLTQ